MEAILFGVWIVAAGFIAWGIKEMLNERRRIKEYDATIKELEAARASISILNDGRMEIASYGRVVAKVYSNKDAQAALQGLGVRVSENEVEGFYHAACRNTSYHGVVVAR